MSRTDRHLVPSPDDDVLLEQLRAIIETVDPVPAEVVAMGKAAVELRRLDAELMRFVALSPGEAAMRSAATSRLHFFERGEVSVDVEVRTSGAFAAVIGAIVDPGGVAALEVTVESPSASFTTMTDDAGCFEVATAPPGLKRVALVRADATTFVTPWFND